MNSDRSCAFCEIAAGETYARVVLEGDDVLGFLDARPLFAGHVLLIPRVHYELLQDLPDPIVPELMASARRVAQAQEDHLDAKGSFVALNNRVSQSVPHLHLHVVPRRPKDGLRGFFWPRTHYRDDAHADDVASILRAALAGGAQSPAA